MILTQCAACAKPLAHDAPRCVRCWTRYCDASCQLEHWSKGHKKQCKKIARGGGAEQFYADAKYKEAADAAVVECAPRIPADAVCYICGDAPSHGAMKGLVSGCGCHGGAGIAHVHCLTRMADAAVKDYEETGCGNGIQKFQECYDCHQYFHSTVRQALGWAAWKTYLGRPETDWTRCLAMTILGTALMDVDARDDVFTMGRSVLETNVALMQRVFPERKGNYKMLVAQQNLSQAYMKFGQFDVALPMLAEIYKMLERGGRRRDERTILAFANLISAMHHSGRYAEAKDAAREELAFEPGLDPRHECTMLIHFNLAQALVEDPAATLADVREAEQIILDVLKTAREVLGPAHPRCREAGHMLSVAFGKANSLIGEIDSNSFAEIKYVAREQLELAHQTLGVDHEWSMCLALNLAQPLYRDPACTLADAREAEKLILDVIKTARRVLDPRQERHRLAADMLSLCRKRLAMLGAAP